MTKPNSYRDTIEEGSFEWYQLPEGGGGFVKSLVACIQRADDWNLRRLAYAFPQMVAAFFEPDWTKAPKGFQPEYNAGGPESAAIVIERRQRQLAKAGVFDD